MNDLIKNALGFALVFTTLKSEANFNFSGGTVTGSKISGQVSADGTAFKDVAIEGSGNFNNCTFSGCTFKSAEGAVANPEGQKTNPKQSGHQNPVGTETASSQKVVTPATGASGTANSTSVTKPTSQGSSVVVGPRSGVPMLNSSDRANVAVDVASKPENKKHSAFVTLPGAEKYRTPQSERFRQQNFQNQLGVREHLKKHNEYATVEKINPADLDSVSNLPKAPPRPGMSAPRETYKADWEMGMLRQGSDGVLYDKWGNRVGRSMYDKKYRDASAEKHSGNHFIHFDEDYKVGGAVIVPKGYYKSLNSGFIFDSSGKKVGEMLSTGEIRWPEFKVDIDPERFSDEYAGQKHY